jgi:uncharacterized membrane protein
VVDTIQNDAELDDKGGYQLILTSNSFQLTVPLSAVISSHFSSSHMSNYVVRIFFSIMIMVNQFDIELGWKFQKIH